MTSRSGGRKLDAARMTVAARIADLATFAQILETIALEGCGGEAVRVVRVPRADGAPSFGRDGGVADDVVAAEFGPVLRSSLEVWNAEARPDWTWHLRAVTAPHLVSVIAPSLRRLVKGYAGVPEPQQAFARQAEPALRDIADGALAFELVSNHWLTCCGAGVYVVERPREWLVIELYAFC